jgi:hypothetical protein
MGYRRVLEREKERGKKKERKKGRFKKHKKYGYYQKMNLIFTFLHLQQRLD